MRTVDDYASGKILEDVKRAESKIQAWRATGDPVLRAELEAEREDSNTRHFLASLTTLHTLILQAHTVAVGPRVCLELHAACEQPSDAVFLDELADALMDAGKARHATKDEAYVVLKRGKAKGHPHLVSIVAEKPMELCNSCTDCCILWQHEHIGIDCIRK